MILENAVCEKPLSARDLARKHLIKISTVHRQMTRLRANGLIPKSASKRRTGQGYATTSGYDSHPLPPVVPPQHPQWKAQDVIDIVNSEVMPELERLQKLSNMARSGVDAISISAIKALEDLGRSRGQTVGPGKPLTKDEQIARLARLLTAVGRKIGEQAFKAAFELAPQATKAAPPAPEVSEHELGPVIEEKVVQKPLQEATEQGLEAHVEFQEETSQEHERTPEGDGALGGLPTRIGP
jgi:hypothetical protein